MSAPDFELARAINMRNTSQEMDAAEIARRTRPVFERHNIERAILFGSFARGRQSRRSDVDLILIQRTARRYFGRFEGLLLDRYYIPTCYPNGLPDLTPGQVYFRRDAEICLESSHQLLSLVGELTGGA